MAAFKALIGFTGYMKVYLMNTYQADMEAFRLDVLDKGNLKVVAAYFGALSIFAGAGSGTYSFGVIKRKSDTLKVSAYLAEKFDH